MHHCQECQQPCRDPYVTDGKVRCRNCHEMLTARWTRNWEPGALCDWNESKKNVKLAKGTAHPDMDYKRSHKAKEDVDG